MLNAFSRERGAPASHFIFYGARTYSTMSNDHAVRVFLNYYKFGIVVDFFCFLLYLYIVFCFHELEIILFDGEFFKNTPLMR